MSEMALTADHLIVIGRGRLIAATSVSDFINASSQNFVRVRTPQPAQLLAVVRSRGAVGIAEADGALRITGLDCPAVGDLAGANGIVIHELVAQAPSLEEAFMEITHDSVDYHTLVKGA